MRYTSEIVIKQPLEKVIELFDNADNMKEWQPGLISFKTIEGTPGQPGAKAELRYQMGKRTIEMVETIMVRNFPKEFTGTYETKGVYNIVRNYFEAIDESQTKYICEHEFKFSGFMKVIAFFMPLAFKKQSMQYLEQFKEFAERAA